MHVQLCALVVAVFAVGCYAQRLHTCPLPSQPCRLHVKVTDLSNQQYEASAETCTCNGGVSCPGNWTDTSHVIRRKLITTGSKIIFKMMFCQHIEPQRICNRGEIALVTTGTLSIPNNVESYTCKCQQNKALHLINNRRNNNYLNQHSYVCAPDKPFCSSANNFNQTCMYENPQGLHFPCRCRRPRICNQVSGWPMRGTCQPIQSRTIV